MVNKKELIKRIEKFCDDRLSFYPSWAVDAIKVIGMWDRLSDDIKSPLWGNGIRDLLFDIEDEFFPTKIRQTVTIEIERESESLLEDTIGQICLVPGVRGVKSHEPKY